MAHARRSSKRKIPRRIRTCVAAESATKTTDPGNEIKPVRGVKLKTISLVTMFFALACLAGFIAVRRPASTTVNTGMMRSLGHDDTRSLLLDGGQGKAGTQKIQKSPGSRAPIHLLFANSQQKHKHPEDI